MSANQRAKATSGTWASTIQSLCSHVQCSHPFLPLAYFRLCSSFSFDSWQCTGTRQLVDPPKEWYTAEQEEVKEKYRENRIMKSRDQERLKVLSALPLFLLTHPGHWCAMEMSKTKTKTQNISLELRNAHQLEVLRFALCIWLSHFLHAMEKPQLEEKKAEITSGKLKPHRLR